jgi:putative (di)nucleoside polyphosphate hydrolase
MEDQSQGAIQILVQDLLSDPLTQLMMKADGVDPARASALLISVCAALTRSPCQREAQLTVSSGREGGYRAGVGILLFNARGEVFVGQRNDIAEAAWQAPQGGVDDGETPLQAALRELSEEIGTDRVEVIAETDRWLRYDFPDEAAAARWNGQWRGQQQKWFAMRFLGTDDDIDLETEHPEFSAWRWVALADLPALAAPFKRDVYQALSTHFGSLSVPAG